MKLSTMLLATLGTHRTATAQLFTCDTDLDCSPTIRSRVPTLTNYTGADMCECYAASSIVDPPFDECEGEGDDTCPTARCAADGCDGLEAYCDADSKECALASQMDMVTVETPTAATDAPVDVDLVTTEAPDVATTTTSTSALPPVQCTVDSDCEPTTRTELPTTFNSTSSASLCDCYADSVLVPFDECEGDRGKDCQKDRCDNNIDACAWTEAYCQVDQGLCALRTLEKNTTAPTPTPPVVQCIVDTDCRATIRQEGPTSFNITEGEAQLCECYADSNLERFDECQGEGRKDCQKVKCDEFACDAVEAYCMVEEGTCALREATVPTTTTTEVPPAMIEDNVTLTSTSSTTTASPLLVECTIDDECSPAIRSEIPSTINATGASLCECYAASDVMPFDECEGDRGKDCQKDKCDGDAGTSCDDMEAYCQVDDGICALRAVVGVGNETSSSTVVPTSAVTKPAEGTTAPTPAGSESKGTSSAPPTPAGSESTGTTAPPTPAGSSESTGTTAPPTPAGSESATTTSPTTGRTAGSDSAGTLTPTAGSETAATTLPTAGSEPAASSAPSAAVTESGGDVSAVVGNPSGDLVSASSNVAVSYLVATFVVLSSLSSIMLF